MLFKSRSYDKHKRIRSLTTNLLTYLPQEINNLSTTWSSSSDDTPNYSNQMRKLIFTHHTTNTQSKCKFFIWHKIQTQIMPQIHLHFTLLFITPHLSPYLVKQMHKLLQNIVQFKPKLYAKHITLRWFISQHRILYHIHRKNTFRNLDTI